MPPRSHRTSPSTVAVALAVATVAACAPTLEAQRVVTRQLKQVRIDAAEWRAGFGLPAKLPARAHRVRFGKTTLWLWDLDGDGKLSFDGADGLSFDGIPFVVPLTETLLLPDGQYTLSIPRARTLGLRKQSLDLDADLVAQAASMTRLRLRHGKTPLRLDEQASHECALHCNYLQIHYPDKNPGMNWHHEEVGAKGYTPGGARAGTESCIYPLDDATTALEWTVATIWHSAPLMDPDVTAFGFAAEKGFSLIRPLGPSHQTTFVHPGDGAEDVPLEFGFGGEAPNPVPGSYYAQGCGYPIYMRVPAGTGRLVGAKVAGEDGEAIAGTTSCPKSPANPEWPSNSGCAAFVPAGPLDPGTVYEVQFAFEGNRTVSWKFRTRLLQGQTRKAWRYTPMPQVQLADPGAFLNETNPSASEVSGPLAGPALPSWVPKLAVGDVRVAQDPNGYWWVITSRSDDEGLPSLHAMGTGATGKQRAEDFARDIRETLGR